MTWIPWPEEETLYTLRRLNLQNPELAIENWAVVVRSRIRKYYNLLSSWGRHPRIGTPTLFRTNQGLFSGSGEKARRGGGGSDGRRSGGALGTFGSASIGN